MSSGKADAVLRERARQGCLALQSLTAHKLVFPVKAIFARGGLQAVVARVAGEDWLLVPGTGYGAAGCRPGIEWAADWRRNARSCLPAPWAVAAAVNAVAAPAQGKSRNWWCRGYLDSSRAIADWLDGLERVGVLGPLGLAVGHSAGGAIVQILTWSRASIAEGHAIGSARAGFDGVPPCDRLHVWAGQGDPVPWVPLGARHVGKVHAMPRGSSRRRHLLTSYASRFEAMLEADLAARATL